MRDKQTLMADAVVVQRDPKAFGVLSTGEQCEVALVLNRLDLLPDWTALQVIDRAVSGGADLQTLIAAQREVLS